jgi:hypothetical protein
MAQILGEGWNFNPPPYWPRPPGGWSPSAGWQPDPAWGPVPPGWQLWVREHSGRRRPWAPLAGLAAAIVIGVVGVRIPRLESAEPRGVVPVVVAGQATPVPARSATPLPTTAVPTTAVPTTAVPTSAVPTAGVLTTGRRQPGVRQFADCPHLNAVYPHGVGLPSAIDKPIRTPVTNFGRSAALYRANATLDLDHDGIACERH